MISKHVPANSFYHTCRYIAQKQGAEVLLSEGVRGHNYKLMAADFEMQHQLRSSKTMSCFHSILSFYPGEKPSDETMKQIAITYLKELGITNTQYAVSKHTDKAHLHMHIVANMVNNEGKAISDSWIGLRGKKIAQRLTRENKLIPALHKNLKLTHMESLNHSEANKYKIYVAISENLRHCRTMPELENRLLKLGIETQYKYKGQTSEKQGISFKIGDLCFKGSQVDRQFSFAGLQRILELQQLQALKHNHKQEFGTNYSGNDTSKIHADRQNIKSQEFSDGGKQTSQSMGKEIKKVFNILMKHEETQMPIPHELSQEAKLKKKKKQSQRISR